MLSKMVVGLPPISSSKGVCEGCVLGKHHREMFEKGKAQRAKEPLQLIHSDLCGPLETHSLSHAFYFLTFIDDFTHKTWVYFLKYKSETFSKFQEFKTMVENESNKKIKTLRTDNGGKFIKNEFDAYLSKHGIQHQKTVPYTPQQNGVAERKNITLVEMARCMLYSKGLHKKFWAEAVCCANYILNKVPHRSVLHVTPEEKWNGRKPDISNFNVFGSESFGFIFMMKAKKVRSQVT